MLRGLKPEHYFTDSLPADLIPIGKVLLNMGVEPFVAPTWDGAYLMDRFISRWTEEKDENLSVQNGRPDYVFDQVGIAVKTIFAWESLALGLFSKIRIAHELILETTNDLQCSAFLASEKFPKQSLQMLRNYCELCVGVIYFQQNEASFQAWRADLWHYHFPDYRKMVDSLIKSSVLSLSESQTLHKKYTKLNNSVHNKRNRLNMNLMRLQDDITSFGINDFIEWSQELKTIVSSMASVFARLCEANYWK